MTSLADRLRGIVRSPGQLPPEGGSVCTPAPPAGNVQEALGGTWSADGRCFTVERRVRSDSSHGRARIGDVAARIAQAAASNSPLSLLTNTSDAAAPFLFFDLETTGLSGGAGTYAFLVGAAWFDAGEFVMRQHVLVDYTAERPMLERVAADFARAGSLVSFNGKSFDAPVLDTRYLFHRLEWPGAGLPHVDALHPSRRFWRQAAYGPRESCSLIALEDEVLGVRRVGDVPGFEIPARYFAFVRSGDARPLAAVLEHNRLDLVSLAALTARLVELVLEGPASATSAWEALALGRAYAGGGNVERACDALERAAAMAVGSHAAGEAPKVEAFRMLALTLRRARLHDEAAAAWRRLLQVRTCPPAIAREANEALAIHHEHRVRDLAAAKLFALQSLGNGKGGDESDWSDAVRHRIQRIEKKERRKMAPLSERPLFPSSSLRPSCGSPTSAPRTSS